MVYQSFLGACQESVVKEAFLLQASSFNWEQFQEVVSALELQAAVKQTFQGSIEKDSHVVAFIRLGVSACSFKVSEK